MTPLLTVDAEIGLCLDALLPHVSFDFCNVMAELRRQAKGEDAQAVAPAQAARILSGDLNALDYCYCWNAVKRHSDNPWQYLAAALPAQYKKIYKDDEYRRALSAITEAVFWEILDATGQEARYAA